MGQPVNQGAQRKMGLSGAGGDAAVVAPGGQFILQPTWALHHRQSREGLGPGTYAAIRFGYRDRQVSPLASLVQVIDPKRPRGDIRLVHHVTVLADGNPCVALRNAADHRGKSPQAERQHVFAGAQFHPAKRNAVENVIASVVLPSQHIRTPGLDIALQIGI
ncbi:hypothetical protein D3C78_1475360 [compost metagenome]